jgi:hypothetical protein
MGLDGTIKREDGRPLGDLSMVQQVLVAVFPGMVFGRLPSGQEKITAAANRGVEFPIIVRRALETRPASVGGVFENESFTADFDLGPDAIVKTVSVLLYGEMQRSEPFWEKLKALAGWVITHP